MTAHAVNPGLRQNCFARAPEAAGEIISPADIRRARARLRCVLVTRDFVRRVAAVHDHHTAVNLLGGDPATITTLLDADVVAALMALADMGEGVIELEGLRHV